jgi:hypothetical protein
MREEPNIQPTDGRHRRRRSKRGVPGSGFFSRPLPNANGPQRSFTMALLCLVALFVFFDAVLFSVHKAGADWAPLWVGGQLSWTSATLAYDVDLVSSLQAPMMGPVSDRPFVYPPSALLLFAPLAALPFTASFLLFGALSALLFERAARPVQSRPILLLAAPPVVLAILAGQPTILVAALVFLGLAQLDKKQGLAGVLWAVAAMIKPPILLLAPVALIAGGYWRAIAAACATATTIGAASLVVFGMEAWLAWLGALPGFNALVSGFEPLLRNAITPYAMAVRIGLRPDIVPFVAAIFAFPMAWWSFARTQDLAIRSVVLVGGALLISPYAMNYELAALAPVVAAWRLERARDVILPAIWAGSLFFSFSLAGLLALYVWAGIRIVLRSRRGHSASANGGASATEVKTVAGLSPSHPEAICRTGGRTKVTTGQARLRKAAECQ